MATDTHPSSGEKQPAKLTDSSLVSGLTSWSMGLYNTYKEQYPAIKTVEETVSTVATVVINQVPEEKCACLLYTSPSPRDS